MNTREQVRSGFLISVLNLYVYSNIHIALCAVGLCLYSFLILGISPDSDYLAFIGFSTIALYCIHRVIGIDKVSKFNDKGRFIIIRKYRRHLIIYSLISITISFYFFIELASNIKMVVILPSILSMLYVMPVFTNKKRLRDISMIKLFLVGVIWAYLTAFIPGISQNVELIFLLKLFVARVLFVIGITIPFDIRDEEIDRNSGVITLVGKLGKKKSKALAITLIIFSFTIMGLSNLKFSFYLTEIIVHLMALGLIYKTHNKRHDYYFSLYIDGLMGIFLVVLYIVNMLLN